MNVQILTKSRINKHCIEGICIVEGKKTEYLLNRYNDSVITEFTSRQEPFFIKFGKDWRNQVNYAIYRALLSFKLNDALLETNIESLYRVVVEFIKQYNKDYKTCDRCCFDIVDDDGDIMEHICIDDKLY